jgi:serine phosphatase RsbU (regulator of sigma subunit)
MGLSYAIHKERSPAGPTRAHEVISGTVVKITALLSNTSARTLILGIDQSGRIVQHDRNAPEMLAHEGDTLAGTQLSDLIAGPTGPGSPLHGLLDAAGTGREATAVLALRVRRVGPVEAVASVQPMQGDDPELASLVILRMPPPGDERFVDPALMRHALLDDTFRRIGSTLDLDQMARGLIGILVPHFCNASGLLVLDSLAATDEFPVHPPDGSQLLRRIAVATDDGDPSWDAAFPTGEVLLYPPGTPYVQCMDTGKPVREVTLDAARAVDIAESWLRRPVARLLTGASMLLLPLTTKESALGFFVCTRQEKFRRFDDYDSEIGMEFASRAAIFIDNARRYSRERTTALTLQRSLLPTGLSAPPSVEVKHRYLPGSKLVEVGGDWYESIELPGARVALVVGDVAGHGVRAAVTMGQLRTAIHTLATLELTPAESLQQLNELMTSLGDREPHFATCAYALYDAVTGTCEIASAGHLPPLLVRPDGGSEFLDAAPAPPLGVGEGPIQSRVYEIDDGSLLVLYTDGLVEDRHRDIDDGLSHLKGIFGPGATSRSLDDLCRAAMAGVFAHHQRDDIAILIARLGRIAEDHHVSWTLPHELISAGRARALLRDPLERWKLEDLLPTTELLVSELVTNAIRYAEGDLTLRLILARTLTCEVLDSSAALPRRRRAARDDEHGRGLQVVGQLAARWGARWTADGKIVWCEQALPAVLLPSPYRRGAVISRPGLSRPAAWCPA